MSNHDKLFDNFLRVKRDNNLRIFDSHVHPLDVMGLCSSKKIESQYNNLEFNKISLPEKLKLGKLANFLLEIVFRVNPSMIEKSIHEMYRSAGSSRLIKEMDYAKIDNSILVPIDPWLKTDVLYNNFKDQRFILLGSVNVHNFSKEELKIELQKQLDVYGIKGIKLHPNLQGFYPIPRDNNKEVSDKLELIYKFVEDNGLYILFHSGHTRFTAKVNGDKEIQKIANTRKNNNALLENFCNKDGKSELLEKYNFPVVIAHMGNYALMNPKYDLLKIITDRYSNVYFDTSGVSPNVIARGINTIGSDKIIFGSDALYYNLKLSIEFCLKAIALSKRKEDKDQMIINIFSKNYQRLLN